uniref:Uncharacterized protein n=1 Tax=Neobodo designis TaxID=312471 RepID=A0A7S1W6V9_NEODS|mmetsp:Transcript_54965/g.169391  ORF Transcript_54965/g.169391 Transcript_54965/m.169391 type:complete len:240 (+) Transcript_54965:53-772(+)|eukprot:CAMPEP_0174835326 /NCGR_PEP_ID=MMETSP1114-20130205/5352_1 /TAXON_ID=312471 /ORGANISM="Neobodo designis, Strain CCAP 1951/1" /LENGTH=239 /DNA_ID=CAMNT_0016069273 /DNA_START=48 /DNA_END=767 /DNA_ORIENTATION=-
MADYDDAAAGATTAQAQLAHLEAQSALHAAADHVSAPPSGRSAAGPGRRTSSSASLAAGSAASDDLRAAKSQIQALQRALKQQKAECDKKDQQIAQITARHDKEVSTNKELHASLKSAEAQLALLKKEITVMQHSLASKAHGTADETEAVRLRRAETELKAAQAELAELKKARAGDDDASNAAKLAEENKTLVKQRAELMQCLRKQNKLIDVLKRQKLHLEAAKLLQIAEQEFTNALDG